MPLSRAERIADGIVHAVGLTFGLAACVALVAVAFPHADGLRRLALVIYAVGLMSMLGCSALYNLTDHDSWKRIFRRLDHAAIFVMIAGTYTPFTLISMSGTRGHALLAAVWAGAIAGAVGKLFFPSRWERFSVAAYLLLGWIIVVALGPLFRAMPLPAFLLLASGGLLYSVGVIFHLWSRLPYQTAIWHTFVVAGAGCHFAAILDCIALA